MTAIESFLFYLPIIINFAKEYPSLKKSEIGKTALTGYAYSIGLPVLFIYIGNEAVRELYSNLPYRNILLIGTILFAYILSNKFFVYRLKKRKIAVQVEAWFMTRFYRDTLYAILIMVPLLLKFYLFR